MSASSVDVQPLDNLRFDNRTLRELPVDLESSNTFRQVHGALFSRVEPTPVSAPRTLAYSTEVADLLGIDHNTASSQDFAEVFSGNRLLKDGDPFAAVYGGHQFGNWAGQLGDGRAIALGEVIDIDGRHQTLQLKGAGPTPFSRRADGRAVLRSSLREFLCSEAMFHLGIPTTRALSLVATGDDVVRDMLYDGHPAAEPGAVVCRVAPSFIRFGNFQLPASRGDNDLVRQLIETTIRFDFPHLLEDDHQSDDMIVAWFTEVAERTASLLINWMRVGFVHGVMNTDNLSILGLTIDYGPYGWLEDFNPGWTPNTTDAGQKRYRYEAQPAVAHWNLVQLANALVPCMTNDDGIAGLQTVIDAFPAQYRSGFVEMMANRLGWGTPTDGDEELIGDLWQALQASEIDQVLFYRRLAEVPIEPAKSADDESLLGPLTEAWYAPEEMAPGAPAATTMAGWLRRWQHRVLEGGIVDDAERRDQMNSRNPLYVLRNYLAQEAIDAATVGDLTLLHTLQEVLRNPYVELPGQERFAARRPDWARTRVGCSMLSCSS